MPWSRPAQRVLLVVAVGLFAFTLFEAARARRPVVHPIADDPTLTVLININTASLAELEALPGIGPALAARIAAHRAARGPFRSVEELREVQGIGEKTLAALRPLVTLGRQN